MDCAAHGRHAPLPSLEGFLVKGWLRFVWLLLILTTNCFVSPLVENGNDAGRRARVAPIVMGLGSRARLFWDKEAGLMLMNNGAMTRQPPVWGGPTMGPFLQHPYRKRYHVSLAAADVTFFFFSRLASHSHPLKRPFFFHVCVHSGSRRGESTLISGRWWCPSTRTVPWTSTAATPSRCTKAGSCTRGRRTSSPSPMLLTKPWRGGTKTLVLSSQVTWEAPCPTPSLCTEWCTYSHSQMWLFI